jgi:hypothetical protein
MRDILRSFTEKMRRCESGEAAFDEIDTLYEAYIKAGGERHRWEDVASKLHGIIDLYAPDKVKAEIAEIREGVYADYGEPSTR